MPESLQAIKIVLDNSWKMMSNLEVLDLGFSFAELFIGILFTILLITIIKILIFGISGSVNSVANELDALKAERINQETIRMHMDRAKAREEFNNLRAAKNFYNPKTNPKMYGPPAPKDLSSLNPKKSE